MVKIDLALALEAIQLAAREDTAQSDLWTPEWPVTGHCALASVLIQNLFGGIIARTLVGNTVHYFNVLPGGVWLDSTRSQFDNHFTYGRIELNPPKEIYWFEETEDKYNKFSVRFYAEYRKLQERIVAL